MDSQLFDHVARTIAAGHSRRIIIKALLAGFAAGAAVTVGAPARAAAHCKRVGHTCHANTDCCPDPNGGVFCASAGKHRKVCQSCPNGTIACDEGCVDASNDVENCGACDNNCATPQGGTAICVSGFCDFSCNETLTACPTADGGGCFDLDSDVHHCGSCKIDCHVPAGGAAFCANGFCEFVCNEGLTACPTADGGGCFDPDSDVHHCGSCKIDCHVPAGGAAFCANGFCDFVCNEGLTACPTADGGGCFDLDSDVHHCGSCKIDCESSAPENTIADCDTGTCVYV